MFTQISWVFKVVSCLWLSYVRSTWGVMWPCSRKHVVPHHIWKIAYSYLNFVFPKYDDRTWSIYIYLKLQCSIDMMLKLQKKDSTKWWFSMAVVSGNPGGSVTARPSHRASSGAASSHRSPARGAAYALRLAQKKVGIDILRIRGDEFRECTRV